jgi:hypothetical protein
MSDFLKKYGTRAVSITLRQQRDPVAKEMADDLQQALESIIESSQFENVSIREAIRMANQEAA